MNLIEKTISKITDLNNTAMDKAQEKINNLLKPVGSLGRLEEIAKQLAGISGQITNRINKKTIIIMASDNGVTKEKVSSYPSEISTLVAETMLKGISGIAVLAKHAHTDLKIIDIGLSGDIKTPGAIIKKIRRGTSNITEGPAMSREEAVKAIEIGIDITNQVIDEGTDLIGTGEVGIGNTTSSSAVLYAMTGENPDNIVGRGAGLDDDGLQHKKNIIKKAVELNKPASDDGIDVVAKVGGFDIAGLTGCYLAAASRKKPIVIDGFISGVAAVIASNIKPETRYYMIPSHASLEPGKNKISEILGFKPMLDMEMRLGEGTGCALAFNLIEAATVMMNEMGSFSDIGM